MSKLSYEGFENLLIEGIAHRMISEVRWFKLDEDSGKLNGKYLEEKTEELFKTMAEFINSFEYHAKGRQVSIVEKFVEEFLIAVRYTKAEEEDYAKVLANEPLHFVLPEFTKENRLHRRACISLSKKLIQSFEGIFPSRRHNLEVITY